MSLPSFIKIPNKILQLVGLQVHRSASLKAEKSYHESRVSKLSEFYLSLLQRSTSTINTKICGIVFSKDRAMQLHALLTSYFHYSKERTPLVVLYTHTSERHCKAYDILKFELKDLPITFVSEINFADQLIDIVTNNESDRIFFMTDDGVFLDTFDLSDCLNFDPSEYIFSLRLGSDFDFCYTHNRAQTIPEFKEENLGQKQFLQWIWKDMVNSPDWIYPLSVDATIFRKSEIEMVLGKIQFRNPNSLEAQMQHYKDLFILRKGVCYQKAKYVNVPCNIVQTEIDNVHTGMFSTTELLERFLNGERINWRSLNKKNPRNVQMIRYTFTKSCMKYECN
jgi:hypothetical protein